MSELPSVFEGSLPANTDALAKLMETNDRLAGGGDKEWRRIAAKKGKFREIINGEEVRVGGDTMNVIIVDSASVSRTYYAQAYNPNATPTAPDCWSDDTVKPSSEVANPQATRCADCPQNIKGSGQGEGRGCSTPHPLSRDCAAVLPVNLGTHRHTSSRESATHAEPAAHLHLFRAFLLGFPIA